MRTRTLELLKQGICTRCGKRPINYNRSIRCCTECLDRVSKLQNKYNHRDRETRKDELNAKQLKYYHKNKAKILERRKTNGINQYHLNWQRNNKDKIREYHKRYSHNNPSKIHAWKRRRLEVKGYFTLQEWESLCDTYKNRCLCCDRNDVKLTIDHVIPLKLGGLNTIDNLQPLCQSCNSKKHIKIIDFRPFGSGILDWT